MLRPLFAYVGIVLGVLSLSAHAIRPSERSLLLAAVRSRAAALADQPVRIKVDRLNVDRGWAVLVGGLVGVGDTAVAWSKAEGCEPELDKMLWVVLHKTMVRWAVEQIEICATEPPYWYLERYGGFVWPCGVYAGLKAGGEETLDKECRRQKLRP